MKSNKKITLAIGLALFISIVSAFILFNKTNAPQDLSFDKALTKIKNKEVSEIAIRQYDLELTDNKNNEKFIVKIDKSDATREAIYHAVDNTGTTIRLEPASSVLGWLLLINALPFIILSVLLLGTIIYLRKNLTKNKG